MLKKYDQPISSVLNPFITGCGWAAALIAASALTGWLAGLDSLKRIFPDLAAMNPATAVGLILCATALLWLRRPEMGSGGHGGIRVFPAAVSAGMAMAVGMAVLVGHLGGWDIGVDRWLFRGSLEGATGAFPDRMAPNTAFLMALSGASLLITATGKGRRAFTVAQAMAAAVLGLAVLVLVGYAYRTGSFLSGSATIPMALNTAVAFLALGFGAFFLRPGAGLAAPLVAENVGGILLRRLLPAAILVPLFLGGTLRLGETRGWFNGEVAFSLLVILVMAFLSVLTWSCVAPLNRVQKALVAARDEMEARVRERTAALTKEQEMLNVVLGNARAHIVACDTSGRVVLDNRASAAADGWSLSPVPRERWAEYFNYRHPGNRLRLAPEELPLFRALRGSVVRGEELLKPDGQGGFRILTASAQPIADPEGNPLGAAAFVHDITEQRQVDRQLQRSQRLESIGTLAGGIAHDLNNVLVPVLMGVQTLREMSQEPDGHKILETVEASTRRGIGVVKQILSFARGSGGERVEMRLEGLVDEHVAMIRETFPVSISIESEIAETLLPVRGDATQLHQVLMNLCLNARDAMPAGGKLILSVRNHVVAEGDPLIEGGVRPGAYVELAVADTGEGISREHIDRVFDPFFTTKELGKGTGLGLSTAVGIVRDHGGFWQVESEAGLGSVFRFFIPAIEDRGVAERVVERRERIGGNGQRVLLVDDDPSVLTVTRGLLERYGYSVTTAGNGLEAVACFEARKDPIDLIIIDMSMPVMDGPTAIRRLRELSPEVPIIAVSGLPENRLEAEKASDGTAYFLLKPYTVGVVLETVRRAICTASRCDEPDLLGQT